MKRLSTISCILYLILLSAGKGYTQERVYSILNNKPDTPSYTSLLNEAREWRKKNTDSALSKARQSLHLGRMYGNQEAIAKALMTLGALEFDKSAFLKSKFYFEEAIQYCHIPSLAGTLFLPKLYTNIANVYSGMGNNDSAIYYQYLSIAELSKLELKDSAMLMGVYNNLSITLFHSEQDDKALYYIQKSMNLARHLKDTQVLGINYRNLGNYWLRSGQKQVADRTSAHFADFMDSARKYLNKTLLIDRKEGLSSKILTSYYQIAMTWIAQRDLKNAKLYLDSAFRADPEYAPRSTELQKGYGDYHFYLKEYKAAIPYYENALAMNIQRGADANNWNLESYQFLAVCYGMTGKGQRAYEYQTKYSELRNKLYNDEKVRIINTLELKYRTSEKDKELANQRLLLLQKENSIQTRNLWIACIAIGTTLLILFFLYFYYNRQKLNREKMERIKRQQELNHLHTVMQAEEEERGRIARELHDGIGVLLSATMMNYTVLGRQESVPLAATAAYKEGMELLQEMRKEIRAIAHNLMPGTITQQNLANAIQSLTARLQQNNSIKIEVEVYGAPLFLQPERSLSIYRMMEELIQNVIKHAEATKILIQLLFHEQQLNVVVQDDGIGFDTEAPYEGIGLQNLRSRTAKLNGEITIISGKGKGTTVELEIPYGETEHQHGTTQKV